MPLLSWAQVDINGLFANNPWLSLLVFLVAYFIGGIPFGFIAGKLKGVDIRKEGSGNIGATNAYRVLGKKWGIGVFICDYLKGYLPVLLVAISFDRWGHGLPSTYKEVLLIGTGIFVLLGHNFTPYLKFSGGKGIASSAGVLLAMLPLSFLSMLLTWVLVIVFTRIVSVASLACAVALPVATWLLYPDSPLYLIFCLLISLLAIYRHRANIQRLRKGEEPVFSWKGKGK